MLRASIASFCLILLGCALAPPPDEARFKIEISNWFNCVVREAAQLDDGKSDAATIGNAAASACRSYISAAAAAKFPDRPALQLELADEMSADNSGRAIEIVLTQRRRAAVKRGL